MENNTNLIEEKRGNTKEDVEQTNYEFQELPLELQLLVFEKVGPVEVGTVVALVSKQWKTLAEHHYLWQTFATNYFHELSHKTSIIQATFQKEWSILNEAFQGETMKAFKMAKEMGWKKKGVEIEAVSEFEDMGLKDEVLRGIYCYGFEKPASVQQKVIPAFGTGRDLIVVSQAGTGKSSSYIVGALQQVDPKVKSVQCLILVPARELCLSLTSLGKSLAEFLDVKFQALVGGRNVRQDIEQLMEQTPKIVVGTPGRTLDMIHRKYLDVSRVQFFIIDEADELCSRGFKEQLLEVHSNLPRQPTTPQVVCLSATYSDEVKNLCVELTHDAYHISDDRPEVTLEGIRQFYVNCEREEWKPETLIDLWSCVSITQCVVFCNTRRKVEWLADYCTKHLELAVGLLHGDLTEAQKVNTYDDFRKGVMRVLICSDLPGLPVWNGVSIFINYDLPNNKEFYLRRVGRSGRFGRKGLVINLLNGENDVKILREIESFYNTSIDELPMDFQRYL